jgi:exportin-1
VLPVDQREGIRNYVVARIMALSGDETTMRSERQFLDRLNLVLVQIVKKEWPHNWPTFISDIVGSSKSSETLCENNLKILRLLSEEIFEFSKVVLFLNFFFYSDRNFPYILPIFRIR